MTTAEPVPCWQCGALPTPTTTHLVWAELDRWLMWHRGATIAADAVLTRMHQLERDVVAQPAEDGPS